MNVFSCAFVVNALGDHVIEVGTNVPEILGRVSIDTRAVTPDHFFIALNGDRFDGHDFIDEAFRRGASMVIAERKRVDTHTCRDKLILVDDTLLALQKLAHAHLQNMPARRVSLTGSNGKTTTKELAAACLRECLGADVVWVTKGNLNNHIGVPLTAFEVTEQHQVVLFEMGMNHLGEIRRLMEIASPEIGLITNIGSAHAGNVGGVEGVAKAKGELFESIPGHGIGIVNTDDPACLLQAVQKLRGHSFRFGTDPTSHLRLVSVAPASPSGQWLELTYEGETLRVQIPLEGAHNAQNAVAAVAIALCLNLDYRAAVRGLENVLPVQGRLSRRVTPLGTLVIDDTYNANPDSMRAGLGTMTELAHGRRKIAALGQMMELDDAEQAHRAMGACAAQMGVEHLFVCGAYSSSYAAGAMSEGMSSSNITSTASSVELAEHVVRELTGDDIIYVKGSRGARMEIVVDRLLEGSES